MRSKRLFRSSLLLALAVLVPLLSLNIPLVHASTYIGYTAAQQDGATCGANCQGTAASVNYGLGQIIKAPFDGKLTSVFIFTGSSTPNRVVIATFGAGNPSTSPQSCSGGGQCPFATAGSSFTVQDSEALTGLSGSAANTISLASPVTVTNGQWVAIMFATGSTSGAFIMLCGGSASPACHTVPDAGNIIDGEMNFGSTNPPVSTTVTTVSNDIAPSMMAGGTFDATGTSGSTVAVTQCYGNCGSPPITLANTNSTHTVNFNQTITLFYQFQSNVNGFLLNVTTSMAKSYTALPNGPAFGVYTIPSCPSGQTPFSTQCPGLLQAQSPGQSFFAPPKGKISFSGLHVPVSNGQWVGIALSAFLSGLDVNDTNTNVNLWQTNEGKIPSSIQAASSLGNSKVGLWAWVNGNVVTGNPPTSPSSGQCGPGLDLILACAVNSLCTVVTTQCQTGSSIFLIVILTIFSIAVMLGIFSYWLPGMNITTKGMGEFAVLIFIGWFVAFAAYGLLLPYMMILMFFVIAWLFLGRSKGTGPI